MGIAVQHAMCQPMKESHPLQGQPLKGTVQDQGIAVQQAMLLLARLEATILAVLVLQVLVAVLELARAMVSVTQVAMLEMARAMLPMAQV